MPRLPRKLVFDPAEVGVYHCINRCVRRAFLCGTDPASGRCFDHRKQWIQDRLEFLASRFAIDVLSFSVLSNHVHVVVRNRPDLVRGWTDDDVAHRWCGLFSKRCDQRGQPPAPSEADLNKIKSDPERLAEIRRRLSDVSWFMRAVAEPIARDANCEDEAPGRFWQGRFRSVPILDEAALTACMAYVDLNPVRARLAESPASSPFTSVFERIHAEFQACRGAPSPSALGAAPSHDDESGSQGAATPPALRRADAAHSALGGPSNPTRALWLSPFEVSERAADGEVPKARASNLGCLSMRFADYLELLNWTIRQLWPGDPSRPPAEAAPIPDRLRVTGEGWLRLVKDFSRLFRRAAGTPASLRAHAEKWCRPRTTGISNSRAIFV